MQGTQNCSKTSILFAAHRPNLKNEIMSVEDYNEMLEEIIRTKKKVNQQTTLHYTALQHF